MKEKKILKKELFKKKMESVLLAHSQPTKDIQIVSCQNVTSGSNRKRILTNQSTWTNKQKEFLPYKNKGFPTFLHLKTLTIFILRLFFVKFRFTYYF